MQLRVVDYVVHPVGPTVALGGNTGGGQIFGVDVVGVGIVLGKQRRQGLFQTLERQAVGGIDTRRTQDADAHPLAAAPGAQAMFGIDPAGGASAFRMAGAGLVDQCPGAIAINPCRTNVDQLPW